MAYTVEQISKIDFGFKKGKYYFIYKGRSKRKNSFKAIEGIYIGEGGRKNNFLIFKTKKGYMETFLKIDILIGEYKIKGSNAKFVLGGEHIV